MYILGINAYHGDSSACIYWDHKLIAASEEERFRRIKHWAGLPTKAIEFCLKEAGINIQEIDVITVGRDPMAKMEQKIWHAMKKVMTIKAIKDRATSSSKFSVIKKDIAQYFGLKPKDLKAQIKFVEHHRSHMASAFYASSNDEAALLSVDGFGDFSSVMRGIGKGEKIEIIDSVSYPHSLGIFYTAFTQYLGFPNYGDEYKVMGLSPYGEATAVEKLRNIIQLKDNGLFELNGKYFKHFKEGVEMNWEEGYPHIGPIFTNEWVKLFGLVRKKGEKLTAYHMNLAASVQKITEETIFHMANDLYKKTGLSTLCLAGGVGQNSVANGKLIEETGYNHLYVPPAAHDAGTSVGSVLYHYYHNLGNRRVKTPHQAYTGARFSNDEIEMYLKERKIEYSRVEDDQLFEMVSNCLLDAGVVGWFQGRAEFGPRALGNRSIIVDPRRADAKELLNKKIKRRESFRPFAPSILKEYTAEYFEQVDEVPFMEKVFKIKVDKRKDIPAVTHVDGSGRLQTVDKKDAPRYHRLISTFKKKSGVPILLNTSFNENEPIVNSPEEALECYLRTKMDMLVMENIIVKRF